MRSWDARERRRRVKTDLREFRWLEKLCVSEAEFAASDLARVGLLKVAEDLRRASAELEAEYGQPVGMAWTNPGVLSLVSRFAWTLLLTSLVLFVALYLPW